MSEVQTLVEYTAIRDFISKNGSLKVKRGEKITEEEYEGLLYFEQEYFFSFQKDIKIFVTEEENLLEEFMFFNYEFPHIFGVY